MAENQKIEDETNEAPAQDAKAVNEVDVSPTIINDEWANMAQEEGVPVDDTATGFELSQDDAAQQRDESVPRVAGLLNYIFGLGFVFWAPAWQVTSEEVSRLAKVWARVAAKYMPLPWLSYVPDVSGGDGSECIECDAVAVTFQTIGPRLQQPRHENADAKSEQTQVREQKNDKQPDAMRDVHGQL